MWWGTFRVGIGNSYYPGVQFAQDEETRNQYFRQMTPNIGGFDTEVITNATSQLFDKIGDGILVTHSHSGGFGYRRTSPVVLSRGLFGRMMRNIILLRVLTLLIVLDH